MWSQWKKTKSCKMFFFFLRLYSCVAELLFSRVHPDKMSTVVKGDKKCQLIIIFLKGHTGSLIKICIPSIFRMASPNLKSDFGYYHIKCSKIAIEILKKVAKMASFVFLFRRVKLIWFMKKCTKATSSIHKCSLKEDLAILNLNLLLTFH